MCVVFMCFWAQCEVTPLCAAGGQLNQRGAERRRSSRSFQRSHNDSGRGGSGRRGQVCVIHPLIHVRLSLLLPLSPFFCLSLVLTVPAQAPAVVLLVASFICDVFLFVVLRTQTGC